MTVAHKLTEALCLSVALLVPSIATACEDNLIVLGNSEYELILSGEFVEKIKATEMGESPAVAFQLTPEGKVLFEELTRHYLGRSMPMRLNGQIVSEPVVREPISSGTGILTGVSQTQAEAIVAAIRRDQAPCNL